MVQLSRSGCTHCRPMQAKETFDLRNETKELQQDVARLTEKNALKSSTAETLKQAMAQLSYEW